MYPVHPGTRRPILSEETTGRKRGASSDLTVVTQMFEEYPLADIGAVTGAVSGFWVLDVDTKDGKNGPAALDALVFEHRVNGLRVELPKTLTAETPSGGLHYFFKHPGRHVRKSSSRLGLGIDVLGDNANVIVPPSRGRRWMIGRRRIAAAPSWLVELVCEERVRGPRVHDRGTQATLAPQSAAAPPSPEMLVMMTENAGRGLSRRGEDLDLPEDTELKIQFALTAIPDRGYDEWMRVGGMIACALRGRCEDNGRGLWEDWSGPREDKTHRCSDFKWSECMKYDAFSDDGRAIFGLADIHDRERKWRRAYRSALIEQYNKARGEG